MKKLRFLTLALVVAVMMMGAGYAYWSDTLTMNNTVKTGEFKVEFVGKKWWGASDKHYENVTTEFNAKTASLELTNWYPGRRLDYQFTVKNTGTIPAVFKNATIEWKKSEALKDVMIGEIIANEHNTGDFALPILEEKLNNTLKGLSLEPGEEHTLWINITLPGTVDNDDKVEKKTLKYNMELNWTQHNDPAVASN